MPLKKETKPNQIIFCHSISFVFQNWLFLSLLLHFLCSLSLTLFISLSLTLFLSLSLSLSLSLFLARSFFVSISLSIFQFLSLVCFDFVDVVNLVFVFRSKATETKNLHLRKETTGCEKEYKGFSCVLWHINLCGLFYAKSCLYIEYICINRIWHKSDFKAIQSSFVCITLKDIKYCYVWEINCVSYFF